MKNGGWKKENEKWKMENGEWIMKKRDWRMENGKIKCGLKWTLMFLFFRFFVYEAE